MATTSSKVLRMSFNTASGKAVSLTLPQPKADITAAQIQAVMDLIISKNIFTGSGGDYVSKRDARIIGTTTDDMYDPPAV